MDSTGRSLLAFGDYSLDPDEGTLRRDGEIVPLQPRVFGVLKLLAQGQGAVVSKKALMDTVWADSFVEEGNLTQSVYALRRTLGTGVDGKSVIETVPKRGYRLTLEVTVGSRRGHQPEPVWAEPVHRPRMYLLIGVALSSLVLAGSLLLIFTKPRRAAPVETVKFQKLTYSGDVSFPVISPDGKSLAFVREDAINLQDIATGSSLKLNVPGHQNFGNLQFSYEGESIFFRTENSFDAAGDIYKVSRFGGRASLIAERVWSTVGLSKDGTRVAYVRFVPNEAEWAVFVRDLHSGDERKLLARNLPTTIFRSGFPAFSPDGRRVAVIEQTGAQQAASKLLLVDVETGTANPVETPGLVQIEQVVWMPTGQSLVVTGREANRFFQLWELDLTTNSLQRITNDLSIYRGVSVSADGQRLLARQFSISSHLWTAQANDLSQQKQITFGNLNRDGTVGLDVMPDGSVIYASRITGNVDLWSIEPESGVRRQLTQDAGTNNESPSATRDGRFVYFESSRSGKRRIWRMNADGSDAVQISPDSEGTDASPVVSPDGSRVYYIRRSPKSSVIWRHDVSSGKQEALTGQASFAPSEFLTLSPDGQFLAFRNAKEKDDPSSAEIVILDVSGIVAPRTFSIKSQNPVIVWSDEGRSFDYVDNRMGNATFWRQSLAQRSEPRMLLEVPTARVYAFRWSRDGNQLILSRGRQETDAIMMTGF